MRRRQVVVLAATLMAALLLGLGIYLGQRAAYSGMGIDPERYRELERALPAARAQVADRERQLEAARTRHEVDRAALEMVRRDLARQRQQIADLDEGLRFYRSLMAPGEIAQGFSLRGFELMSRDQSGHYAYRLVAQQEARKHRTVRGDLQIEVLGLREGQPVSYPLSELARDMESNDIPLRFRYFQAVEGEMEIPEGFEPQAVEVVATVSSPRKLEIREQYPWQLQEKFTHAGK